MHFAENTVSAAGKRLFNVVVNGERVLTTFDIFATIGAMNTAVIENFIVKPDENGVLDVQFVPGSADQPTVGGIELIPRDSDQPNEDDAPATVVRGSSGGAATAGESMSGGALSSTLRQTSMTGNVLLAACVP